MARIPVGPGQVITQPAPQGRQLRQDAFGGGLFDATGQMGRAVSSIAGQELDAQQREQMRLANEAEQERRRIAKAAEDAQRLSVVTDVEDGLADLRDTHARGIRDGSIPKDKAESIYRADSQKLLDKAAEDLGPLPDRALVVERMKRSAERHGNEIRRAVTDRDRHDISSAMSQTLEYLQRQYQRDPGGATQQAMELIQQYGPLSSMPPEQVAKLGQAWKETTQFTAGHEAVSAGRHDLKALKDAEEMIGKLPDLDPQKRATLMDRAANYRFAIQQDMDRKERQRQQHAEAMFNKAEKLFQVGVSESEKGTLNPQFRDELLQGLAGTPFQSMFRSLIERQAETGPLAARPVHEQRDMLQSIDQQIAQEGRHPGLTKQRERVEKILRGTEQDIEKLGDLGAALKHGVIDDIPRIDLSSPQAAAASIPQRMAAHEAASRWLRRPAAPMTDDEARAIKTMIEVLPAKEQSQTIASLASSLGPQAAMGLGAQIGKGAHDEQTKAIGMQLRYGAAATTEGRLVSELIGKGARAIKDKTIKEEKTPVDGWLGQINKQLDGLYLNQKQTEETAQAARLILAGLVAEGASGSSSDAKQAVSLAMGGFSRDINGSRTILPAGMESRDVRRRLDSMTADEVKTQAPSGKLFAAGAPMTPEQFLKALPDAQLQYAGLGKYFVKAGKSGFVTNDQLQPLVIEVPYGSR